MADRLPSGSHFVSDAPAVPVVCRLLGPSIRLVMRRRQDAIGAHANLKPQKRGSLMFPHAAGSPKLPTPTKVIAVALQATSNVAGM